MDGERTRNVTMEEPRKPQPNLYGLVVGVGSYPKAAGVEDLRYAVKDAQDVARLLERQRRLLFGEVRIKRLCDREATRDNIVNALHALKDAQENDVVILYLAGHGAIHDELGGYCYLPYDVSADANDVASLVVGREIRDRFLRLRAAKKILILDTCHAGDLGISSVNKRTGIRTRGVGRSTMSRAIKALEDGQPSVIILAACDRHEKAAEADASRQGLFTKALLDGLRGKGDLDGDGTVSSKELADYLKLVVPDLSTNRQNPQVHYPLNDPGFAIAKVLPGQGPEEPSIDPDHARAIGGPQQRQPTQLPQVFMGMVLGGALLGVGMVGAWYVIRPQLPLSGPAALTLAQGGAPDLGTPADLRPAALPTAQAHLRWHITSDPPGAVVLAGSGRRAQRLGVTPLFVEPRGKGIQKVTLRKSGYLDRHRDLDTKVAEVVHVKLAPASR